MDWNILQLMFVLIEICLSLAPHEVTIIILSQPTEHHLKLARNLRTEIHNQSSKIDNELLINVQISCEVLNHPGDWTILAILPDLVSHPNGILNKPENKWLIFCEDQSSLNVKNLINVLSSIDHKQKVYLGYPLYDQEATIVHHFAFFENPQWFAYPMLRSGVAFTLPLVKTLAQRIQEWKPTTDFFIDASHELSLFIWNNIKVEKYHESLYTIEKDKNNKRIGEATVETINHAEDSKTLQSAQELPNRKYDKLVLTAAPAYFCSSKKSGCAISPKLLSEKNLIRCVAISPETIYFAIKTCQKFHKERISTIKMTWGRYAVHKKFFSDINDEFIPTTCTGVPNTETGHCEKTLSILKLVLNDIKQLNIEERQNLPKNDDAAIKWIFLSDDDTLLSVLEVSKVLGCYDSKKDIYLGERYGYRLHSKDGFNYITGGGGIAFSISAAQKLIETCTCPSIHSPDDMIIGMCMQRQGIWAIHSSQFHQARPPDYSHELLELNDAPVSFHKFWQIDPISTYKKWFSKNDQMICRINTKHQKCDITDETSHSTNTKLAQNLSNDRQMPSPTHPAERVDL